MNQIWIFCAKCFSSWKSLQALMTILIIWLIILLGISGGLTASEGGSFSGSSINGKKPYRNWDSSVCQAEPYIFMRPFQFTYAGGSNASICPSPSSNSEFRFVISVFGIICVACLFFNTPMSFLARIMFLVYALLFFAATVMDVNSTITGLTSCQDMFANTQLHTDMVTLGITSLSCSTTTSGVLCFFDIAISIQFFFLHTAWLFCKDRYVRAPTPKTDTTEQKSLLHSGAN